MSSSPRARLTPRGRALLAAAVVAALFGTGAAYLGRPATEAVADAEPTAPAAVETETSPPVATWAPAEPVALDESVVAQDLVDRAPVAVLVAEDVTGDELRLAAWLGRRLVAPVVHPGGATLRGLDTAIAVAVGDVASPTDTSLDVRRVGGPVVEPEPVTTPSADATVSGSPTEVETSVAVAREPLTGTPVEDPFTELPTVANRTEPPVAADLTEVEDLLADAQAVRSGRTVLAAKPAGVRDVDVATAVALGHAVVAVTDDPRADAGLAEARRLRRGMLVAWGEGWDGDGASDADLLAVVRAGHELPGGGYRLFPDRRMIALYGHPEGGALGLLGEQPPAEAVARTQGYVDSYAGLFDEPVIGAFDLITTVASAGAGPRGDYSRRTPIETLRPWVDAAGEAGIYVVLDLQSGRTDFLTQAKEYEELLLEPHVGIALDPEWRLLPNQRHLRQIGSVSGHEVNQVIDYVADLTREHALPQKLLVVHQFKLTMIRDREVIDTTRPELAVLIHMDGQGSQGAKNGTYATVTRNAPEGIWWGWKNFLDEDLPGVRSPEATAAVEPKPWFISYQ